MTLNSYQGLPGVSGGKLSGPYSSSPSAVLRALKDHRATSSASDDGAIMVWIDDAGAYRAEFHRYCVTQGSGTFTSKSSLLAWLKAWWPAMAHIELAPTQQDAA